ncbi:hypothetical protein BCR26_15195 [Enterococcus rivorum]|uniref:Uncharacterized protein n=1 Tax=Enterococcus rivorum TaxID=762845 RepID=A0A1E5KVZ9_9ENTE|nr:hypothetical protein BCR26_15195 [Enterococcus rivorum]
MAFATLYCGVVTLQAAVVIYNVGIATKCSGYFFLIVCLDLESDTKLILVLHRSLSFLLLFFSI